MKSSSIKNKGLCMVNFIASGNVSNKISDQKFGPSDELQNCTRYKKLLASQHGWTTFTEFRYFMLGYFSLLCLGLLLAYSLFCYFSLLGFVWTLPLLKKNAAKPLNKRYFRFWGTCKICAYESVHAAIFITLSLLN